MRGIAVEDDSKRSLASGDLWTRRRLAQRWACSEETLKR